MFRSHFKYERIVQNLSIPALSCFCLLDNIFCILSDIDIDRINLLLGWSLHHFISLLQHISGAASSRSHKTVLNSQYRQFS